MREEDREAWIAMLEGLGLSDDDVDDYLTSQVGESNPQPPVRVVGEELEDDELEIPAMDSDETLEHVLALGADLEQDPEYEATQDVYGAYVATSFTLAKSCIFAIQETGEDTLLEQIAREAFAAMSSDAQASFCEKGL